MEVVSIKPENLEAQVYATPPPIHIPSPTSTQIVLITNNTIFAAARMHSRQSVSPSSFSSQNAPPRLCFCIMFTGGKCLTADKGKVWRQKRNEKGKGKGIGKRSNQKEGNVLTCQK
jgi:hypothetical protein